MSTVTSLIKEVPLDYRFFSVLILLYCPICKYHMPRTRRYKTLKSLSWHLAHDHTNEIDYPIKLEQIQEILKVIAIAKQMGILP